MGIKGNAKTLRKNQTEAEKVLWYYLRDRRFAGLKFRRQHPIGPFIADFVCIERRLVIELDGGQHSLQAEDDQRRSVYLESEGYFVLRFWSDQVFKESQAVLEVIRRTVANRSPSPRPSPPESGAREK